MLLVPVLISAQNKKFREGNKLYEEGKYSEAAKVYQEGLTKKPNFGPGMFNLGNALYKQKNYDAARQTLSVTARQSRDRAVKANAHYNIGNSYMEEQKWQEAVNAYKQALKLNPQDEQAKYNLSYALQMLKKNQGGGGSDQNKDQQNQEEQDKQDQQQDQDQKEQDQQNQDQQNQEQNQKEQEQEQKKQPQPSNLSEQQAEQLLNALSQEEKKLHEKKEKGRAVPVRIDKDW